MIEPSPEAGKRCAGNADHSLGPMSHRVTGPSGIVGYACKACAQRASVDGVFRDTPERCIAAGTTIPETEAAFAKLGRQMPTTPASVRATIAELIRRYERDTGRPGPSIDDAARAMLGGAL